MTSDNYIDAVKPFVWLFNKYWLGPDVAEIVVAGFSAPEFNLRDICSNTAVSPKWHSIGKFENYPISKWSDALMDLLSQVDDEFIILMLEDYWIIRDVNVGAVRLAHEYMTRYPKTLKFDLAGDRFFAGDAQRNYRYHGWLDIVKSKPGSPYHMSLMTGLWNVKLLRTVLKKDWDPWNVEIDGTTHLSENFPELDVVGSGQWPIRHTLAFRSGDSSKLLLNEIKQEDIYSLKQKGYLKPWGL